MDAKSYARELSLEQEMLDRGRSRFLANLSRLRELREESGTSYGKSLLRRGVEPLAAGIAAFLAAAGSGAPGRRSPQRNESDTEDPGGKTVLMIFWGPDIHPDTDTSETTISI